MIAYFAAFPNDVIFRGVSFRSVRDIPILMANIIEIAIFMAGILAIIFITYSGIQYIVSSGDPAKVQTAKAGLRNAVVGLIIATGAYLLVEFFAGRLS